MKGIAHFVTGMAVASFFPEVVLGASGDLSFGPMLGGFAGLVPDTLDFKFVRYFHRVDEEIDPARITTDAGHPDPQAIAERIAMAMNRAYENDARVTIQLHTLRLGADLWRQYAVAFDLLCSEVVVRIGPVVTTGEMSYPASEVPGLATGRVQVDARICPAYDAEIKVDVFSGPSLAFEKVGDAVQVTFLPWHRAWSHSLLMVLLLGAAGFLLAPVYGLVMALAALAHLIEDQMGNMGCNILFPLTRKRTMGLKWMRSGDAIPNFLTVWVGLAVILLNLDRFSGTPIVPFWSYLGAVVVIPWLFFIGLSAWESLHRRRQPSDAAPRLAPAVLAAVEALDETDEVDI